jgi:phosphate transport system substrate-binding protein
MPFDREHGNDAIQAALRDFVTRAIPDGQGMAADLG